MSLVISVYHGDFGKGDVFLFFFVYLREMSQWHLTTTYAYNTAMVAGEEILCILLS